MKKWLNLILLAGLLPLSAAEFELGKFIRERYRDGVSDIVLPDGELRCSRTVTLGPEIRNVTIRGGRDTKLIITRLVPVFFLNGCANVTLRDFCIDYDPLPFTQGTITAIDTEKHTIRYRLHDGYPRLTKPYLVRHPLFFNRETRTMSYDTKLCSTQSNKALSPDEGEITTAGNRSDLKIGDFVVLNNRVDSALKVRGLSDSLKFINLTIYSAPGLGIVSRRTKGRHEIRNCRMIRGPLPAGATEARLLSLSADGINYATSRQGPLIEGNEIAFIGDDSINLHGRPFTVVRPEPERKSFICATTLGGEEYFELLLPGDTVRLLAPNNFALRGTATIRKVEFAEHIPDLDKTTIYKAAPVKKYIVYRITVDGPLPEANTLVDFPAINMPDFVIRNNYFHDHRARGMRIMARNGLIENNRIECLEHQGISLGPEYGYWIEAGWVENITVRNNRIDSVCLGGSAYGAISYSLGAICTFVHNENGDFGFYPGNRGVVIENNQISNCALAGIYLLASEGAIVRNNIISNVNWGDSSMAGANFGIRYQKEPIGILGSKDTIIENNKIKP